MRSEPEEFVLNMTPLQLWAAARSFTAVTVEQEVGGAINCTTKEPATETYAHLIFRSMLNANGHRKHSASLGQVFANSLPDGKTLVRVGVSSAEDANEVWAYWDSFLAELDRQGWLSNPLPSLNRLQQGILEVHDELTKSGERATNSILSLKLHERGIYNKALGYGYTAETISREKTKLRNMGHNI